jgi:hypothetical protein
MFMAADDTIHPEIPHLEYRDRFPENHRVTGFERSMSARGFASPHYVEMRVWHRLGLDVIGPLTELLVSIGSNPEDRWKFAATTRSFPVYVPVDRIAAVEARFIADGNAGCLQVLKLPPARPTNPIRQRSKRKS